MSGQSLFERLEDRQPAATRRFVWVTGDASQPDTRAFLDRTRQPVLSKPYEATELLAAVAMVVQRARAVGTDGTAPGA